jgi:hypothetical protein
MLIAANEARRNFETPLAPEYLFFCNTTAPWSRRDLNGQGGRAQHTRRVAAVWTRSFGRVVVLLASSVPGPKVCLFLSPRRMTLTTRPAVIGSKTEETCEPST